MLCGEGASGTAAQVLLTQPQGVLQTSDGRLIVADIAENRLVEITPDGTLMTLVSGNPDDAPVADYVLEHPDGIALGPRDELYFVDGTRVLRYEAGRVEIYAGGGTDASDGIVATSALLSTPSGLAVDTQGDVYVSERDGHRVRKILTDGSITTVAGTGVAGYDGEGGQAKESLLNDPHGLALDPEGQLYIVDQGNNRIRRVAADGSIQTVIGGGTEILMDAALTVNLKLDKPDGIAAGPDGMLYLALRDRVIKVFVGVPNVDQSEHLVPSTDGRTIFRFDKRGKHLETLDAVTGTRLLSFGYDETSGQLMSITDQNNQQTRIERDGAGTPTAIIAPFGQRTKLMTNPSRDIEYIEDPLGRKVHLTWNVAGFVEKIEDPKTRGWVFAYDGGTGRLTSVSDPTGYEELLGRVDTDKGWQVTVSSSNGSRHVYDVQYGNEAWKRVTFSPDGSEAVLIDAGASMTRTSRDGTEQSVTFRPDHAFGAQVLLPESDTITFPSGNSYSTEYILAQRNVNDIYNPLDLVAWTDQVIPNGREYVTRYDRTTRQLTQISPMGRTSVTTLDTLGHPIRFEQAAGPVIEWEYDPSLRGRLKSTMLTAGGESRTSTYRYDSGGWLEYFVDAALQESRYGRDAVGRVTTVTTPDQAMTAWTLDDASNVKTFTPPNNQNHQFGYHPIMKWLSEVTPPAVSDPAAGKVSFEYEEKKHQLKAIRRSDARSIAFGYNAQSELESQTLQNAALTFGRTRGRVTQVRRSDGVTVSESFDGPLWTGTTWSDQIDGSVKVTYDSNLWLDTLTVNGASSVAFEYDGDGLLTSATTTAGRADLIRDANSGQVTSINVGKTTTDLALSGFNELTHLDVTHAGTNLFVQDVLERDPLGRIRHLTETAHGVSRDVRYEYDAAGRLKLETRDGVVTGYTYDSNGNRASSTVSSAAPEVGSYDAQDRILSFGTRTYTHSNHGDLETRSEGAKQLTLSYDELGNLLKAVHTDGAATTTVQYLADGYGRRVARKLGGKIDRTWLYQDALRPVAEIDAAGSLTHFIYASHDPYSGAPIAMVRAGAIYRIITDHLGSVRLVVNAETGEVAQSLDYDAWGRVVTETGSGFQPFGFAGGLYDAATGLVRFGARDYDPETGRWTNKDPIGFAGQQGSVYVYVNGDPVNRVDPSGLADIFIGAEVDAIAEEKGGSVGLGVVWDTDHPDESGVYLSIGRGIGLNVGASVGMGVCKRDIEGSGGEIDVNGAVVSAQAVLDDRSMCGAGLSMGPGLGTSVAVTKTSTLTVKSVRQRFVRAVLDAMAYVSERLK